MTYRGNVDARYHNAVLFAEQQIMHASDWQEVQHALADHEIHGPYIESIALDDMDKCAVAQKIIREAEDNLGSRVPY